MGSIMPDLLRARIELDKQEISTILAALRHYQKEFKHSLDLPDCLFDIATNFEEFEPLMNNDIDDLCKKLNCTGY